MHEQPRRYFLLDREGVMHTRQSVGRARCWDNFAFLPRSLDALRLLAEHHYAGIVISRQAPARQGASSPCEPDAITRRFLLEVALSGGHIAQVYYCRHRLEEACTCHNPSTGLIARAKAEHGFQLENSYFVGEPEMSLQWAMEAGCPCIRIQRDAFLQARRTNEEAWLVASNLYEAAEQILASNSALERLFSTAQA